MANDFDMLDPDGLSAIVGLGTETTTPTEQKTVEIVVQQPLIVLVKEGSAGASERPHPRCSGS